MKVKKKQKKNKLGCTHMINGPSCQPHAWLLQEEEEREKRESRDEGERIEGHTRQWGLCGHLSAADGEAVDPERSEREKRGV